MSKVFIITGTRKGIGKELAGHFLAAGNIVAGCSRGSATISDKNYRHYELDVTNESEVAGMVRDVEKQFKKIDVLINNAGIASMNHFTLTPLSKAKEILETNFLGTFLFSREAAKVMIRKRTGRIINFVTVAVPLQIEGESVYAASKAAVHNFTQITARELGPFGITVNAIGPNPVMTDLIKTVPREKIEALVNRQAIKRAGTVQDIINVINFFVSDQSGMITGQTIYLGGING